MFIILLALLVSVYAVDTELKPTYTYTYKTVGITNLLVDVYVPTSTPYDKYPVIFAIHRGGFVFGERKEGFVGIEVDEVLSRGWVGVSIDYRLSPGVLIDEIFEDVQDAYTWVHIELTKILPLDLDRVAILGQSAGGGIAVIGGYKLIPRPKVIVALYPFCTNFTDPYSYNTSTPVPEALVTLVNSLRQSISNYKRTQPTALDPRDQLLQIGIITQKLGWLLATHDRNQSVNEIMSKLIEYSAVYNIDEEYPPIYLAHGLADAIVPYTQSVELAEQLKLKNKTYVLDLVPGARHVFDLEPEFWDDHVIPFFDFVEIHLTGQILKFASKLSFSLGMMCIIGAIFLIY